MTKAIRILFDSVKSHPVGWLILVFTSILFNKMLDGFLEWMGVGDLLVRAVQNEKISHLLISAVGYIGIFILCCAMLLIGIAVGSRHPRSEPHEDTRKISNKIFTVGNEKSDIGVATPPAQILPEAQQPLIIRSFIVRSIRSRDGIDLKATIFIRNRSVKPLNICVTYAAWETINGKHVFNNAENFKYTIDQQSDFGIRLPSTRVFSDAETDIRATASIEYCLEGSKQCNILDFNCEHTLKNFSQNGSTDAVSANLDYPSATFRTAAPTKSV